MCRWTFCLRWVRQLAMAVPNPMAAMEHLQCHLCRPVSPLNRSAGKLSVPTSRQNVCQLIKDLFLLPLSNWLTSFVHARHPALHIFCSVHSSRRCMSIVHCWAEWLGICFVRLDYRMRKCTCKDNLLQLTMMNGCSGTVVMRCCLLSKFSSATHITFHIGSPSLQMADWHSASNNHTQNQLIGVLHAYLKSKATRVECYYAVDMFSIPHIQQLMSSVHNWLCSDGCEQAWALA